MASANITMRGLNKSQLADMLQGPNGPVAKDMLRRGYKVESAAKRNVTKNTDTGRLRSSISTILISRNQKPVVRVGTDVEYALFIHNGTKAHGPRRAKMLRWEGKGGQIIWAKRVRGIKANPFLLNALDAAKD